MLSIPPHSPLAVPVEDTASHDGGLVPIDRPLGASLQACPLRGTGPSVVGDTTLQYSTSPAPIRSSLSALLRAQGCELDADRPATDRVVGDPRYIRAQPKYLLSMNTREISGRKVGPRLVRRGGKSVLRRENR